MGWVRLWFMRVAEAVVERTLNEWWTTTDAIRIGSLRLDELIRMMMMTQRVVTLNQVFV